MGFLSSRFTFTSSRGQFHSSGMTDGDSVTGSTSLQSFNQRQTIEKNRKVIASYREAAVTRSYRDGAFSPKSADESKKDPTQEKHNHRQKYSSRIDVNDRNTSQIRHIHSSRIDIVKPSRQQHNAENQVSPKKPIGIKPGSVYRPQIGYREPNSRRYNPYG